MAARFVCNGRQLFNIQTLPGVYLCLVLGLHHTHYCRLWWLHWTKHKRVPVQYHLGVLRSHLFLHSNGTYHPLSHSRSRFPGHAARQDGRIRSVDKKIAECKLHNYRTVSASWAVLEHSWDCWRGFQKRPQSHHRGIPLLPATLPQELDSCHQFGFRPVQERLSPLFRPLWSRLHQWSHHQPLLKTLPRFETWPKLPSQASV